MAFEALILDSGEWILSGELAASPWHILIYRQRGRDGNELHLWLPRQGAARSGAHAFKRYWGLDSTRWCVEIPARTGGPKRSSGPTLLRFSAPDGRVLWARSNAGAGLGDLSETELVRLLRKATAGPYFGD